MAFSTIRGDASIRSVSFRSHADNQRAVKLAYDGVGCLRRVRVRCPFEYDAEGGVVGATIAAAPSTSASASPNGAACIATRKRLISLMFMHEILDYHSNPPHNCKIIRWGGWCVVSAGCIRVRDLDPRDWESFVRRHELPLNLGARATAADGSRRTSPAVAA